MRANGKIAAKMIGVSKLIIEKATIVRKNCIIIIRRLKSKDMSAVSISFENLFKILPIGVVSEKSFTLILFHLIPNCIYDRPKKDMGALMILIIILLCKIFAALMQAKFRLILAINEKMASTVPNAP